MCDGPVGDWVAFLAPKLSLYQALAIVGTGGASQQQMTAPCSLFSGALSDSLSRVSLSSFIPPSLLFMPNKRIIFF